MSKNRPGSGDPAPSSSRTGSTFAALALILFIAVAGVWAWNSTHNQAAQDASSAASPQSTSSAAPTAASFAGRSFPSQGHTHLQPDEADDFVYNSNPPTSGPHKEIFTNEFVSPTPLPPYIQVHLLEHGNVLLQYSCTCPDVASALSSIAYTYDSPLMASGELQAQPNEVGAGEEQGKAVVVAPYPHMRARIALTAWTRLATLDSVDKSKVDSFINLYLTNEANASQ